MSGTGGLIGKMPLMGNLAYSSAKSLGLIQMPTDNQIPEKVTKIHAASRQLRTAIRMFFIDGDTISIHTLTAAAHEILRNLLRSKGSGSLIKDSPYIRPERRKEFIGIVNNPENFFKHAARDPDREIKFPPIVTQYFLFDAIEMYGQLTGRMLREGAVFRTWFALNHPDLITDASLADTVEGIRSEMIDPSNRSVFLASLNRADLFPNTD